MALMAPVTNHLEQPMFTTAMFILAATYLGAEVPEGGDAEAIAKSELEKYGLSLDQFLTPATQFAMGYHRGLSARSWDDSSIVQKDGKPDAELASIVEIGFAYGLEARDLAKAPPPSLVYAAHESGAIKAGGLGQWAATLDLKGTSRLAASLEVGSGKTALTVPAGTPVDVLGSTTKDGVDHVIVGFDGMALLVPNPASDARIVDGDVAVAPVRVRKSPTRKPKDPNAPVKERAKTERGPSLRDAIIHVIEAQDGGDGPLATDGVIASRVAARCRELGIADKAASFLQKANKHVPYYLNIYGPDKNGHINRLGIEKPLTWVVAAIDARRAFLKGGHAAIPAELAAKLTDRAARMTATPAPAKPKEAAAPAADAPPAA